MNNKALKTLEYNKIIERLEGCADSLLGKKLCKDLLPLTNINEIKENQTQTTDALSRIYKHGSPSFSGTKNITPSLLRLQKGSTLSLEELLNISLLLDASTRIKTYLRQDEEVHDSLTDYYEAIEPLTPLNSELKRCIISVDEVSDDASSTLKQIRRTIRNTNDQIHQQLGQIVNSSSTRSMLQENIVTMRNGRYCLPIKLEYKSSFPGMVHDQSSSGSTVFIEPMAVVKLNNELRELFIKEQEEIERILSTLSNLVADEVNSIQSNVEALTKLDFIFAKAKLSRSMKASEPNLNTNGYIQLKSARHPLIDPNKVVPIDLHLGRDFRLLIITGPNTGGKTVSLKTVGLFTLMGQAGLHIPAFDGSTLSVFEDVFADIGDEQSIEQSLSTFSSHMTNTVSILNNATEKSLVLFDELGAGTDPTEGAALAISILNDLYHRGVTTMATTHYSELKIYALTTDGIENACCEFDVESLRPTYRLLIGIPGKSNAFAISSKLGLPDYIIEDAKKHIDTDAKNFEDVISSLEENRILLEREHAELEKNKQEISRLRKQVSEQQEKLQEQKEKIITKAKEEAQSILQDAKDYADESIRKYNKWMSEGNFAKEMEQERTALGKKLKKNAPTSLPGTNKHSNKKLTAKDLSIGDDVFVLKYCLHRR